MSKLAAFWDTSALLPLCVHQPTSPRVIALSRKWIQVVWWGSPIEVRSGIARLFRQGLIDAREKSGAIARLGLLNKGCKQIIPDNSVRDLAMEILDTYALRAGDSLQLAAALAWCHSRPSRRVFICADTRLNEAAKAAGFTTVEV